MSREAPAPFCEGLAGKFRRSTHHETFNTLKNQGYNFEHNYGHGVKNLSNVMAGLMILVFTVDQLIQTYNKEFQACHEKYKSRKALWEKIRSAFGFFLIESWDDLYAGLLDPPIFSFPSVNSLSP